MEFTDDVKLNTSFRKCAMIINARFLLTSCTKIDVVHIYVVETGSERAFIISGQHDDHL